MLLDCHDYLLILYVGGSTSCIRWRLIFAILGAMGMAIIYGLKVNLSVAIVAMLNHTNLESLSKGHGEGHSVAAAEDVEVCFNTTKKEPGKASSEARTGFVSKLVLTSGPLVAINIQDIAKKDIKSMNFDHDVTKLGDA